jgi:pyridoxal phosphate enzyme (YggS family)
MHKNVINLLEIENKLKIIDNFKNCKIIAVSKTFNKKDIKPLIDHGHEDFGENKIQEAIEKWTSIKSNNNNIKLHMLGKIQTNKVKYLIPLFDYLHSLDSLKLAEKIFNEQEKKNKKIKIFIQVNIGAEEQKGGIGIHQVDNFYYECVKNFKLDIVGLMCIPPYSKNSKSYFMKLREIASNLQLTKLSMGMSGDYTEALECGSNFLRIGTAIFGKRT